MQMDNDSVRRRLMFCLWAYEISVILVCLWSGYNIATSHGGNAAMAIPLLLIALAEGLRIPLTGYASRLRLVPQLLAVIVLLAIAVGSFEGLTLAFEQFVHARVFNVMSAQAEVKKAQTRLDAATEARANAQREVDRMDKAIAEVVAAAPKQPALSGQTCAGRRGAVTCSSDLLAQRNFVTASKAHETTLAGIRRERSLAQAKLESMAPTPESFSALDTARVRLANEVGESPMHRIAASVYGVAVEDITPQQFEVFKKWAVFSLAGAFAVLSAAVSFVAHQHPREDRETKLSRALRAYLARKRKGVVRIVEVPKYETERVLIRYVPVDGEASQKRLGNYELRGENLRAYKELL